MLTVLSADDTQRAWQRYREIADQPDRFTRWMLERSLSVLEVGLDRKQADPQGRSQAYAALTQALLQMPEEPPVPVDRRVDLLQLSLNPVAAKLMVRLFSGDMNAWPLDAQQENRANPWGGFREAWLEHYNQVLRSEQEALGSEGMAETQVLSEVAGSVWKIHVAKGDLVKKDQELMILESMKMEIPVEAPCDGTIADILVAPEVGVEEDQVLLILAS